MAWPGRFAGGSTEDRPVSTVDVFATALAVAGVAMPTERHYDSVNLLPFLIGEKNGTPHDRLFWRNGRQLAVREGGWKLVRQGDRPAELYDLDHDIGESRDLAQTRPEVTARLSTALEAWNRELMDPAFPGDTGHNAKKSPTISSP